MNMYKENLSILKDGYEHAEYAIESITGKKLTELEMAHDLHLQTGYGCLERLFSICESLTGETTLNVLEEACDIYSFQRVYRIIKKETSLVKNTQELAGIIGKQIKEELNDIFKNAAIIDFSLNAEVRPSFNTDYWQSFASAYPVMIRLLKQKVEHWDRVIIDILSAFARDHHELKKWNNHQGRVEITDMQLSLGDFHESGKSVVMVGTTIGKFIYKPRNACNERILTQIIDKMNFNIGLPLTLDKESYSWHQFIEPTSPVVLDDIYLYYKGIGHLLALSWLLYGYDFHFENIIVKGGVPYVIDSECLFVNVKKNDGNIFSDSVLNTCLIPALNASERDIFRCGIGLNDESKIEFKRIELKQDASGKIHQNEIIDHTKRYFNSPDINVDSIDFNIIKDEIMLGFNQAVEIFSSEYKKLLATIKTERNISSRVLFRSSKEYAKILFLAKHPRFIMSEISREMLISTLIYKEDIDESILKEEFHSLMEDRIPLFSYNLNQGEFTINNKPVDVNQYKMFNCLHEHIADVNDESCLDFQRKLIRISLETIFPRNKIVGIPTYDQLNSVLNFILADGFLYKNNFTGLNLKTAQNGNLAIVHSENNIYSGLCGIVFLKICLFIIDEKAVNRHDVDSLFNRVHKSIAHSPAIKKGGYGAFESKGSLLYIAYLMTKYISKAYADIFKEILFDIVSTINALKKPEIDVISGAAGILIICTRMYKITADKAVFSAITSLVDLIRRHQIILDSGTVTWGKKYTGFSHGNSGVIYSLALANEINYQHDTVKMIQNALLYEQEQQISDGWRDFRNNEREVDFNAWCHGAAGIFMARQALLRETTKLPEETLQLIHADITHYESTRELREENSHPSLCHGAYGNAVIENSRERLEISPHRQLFDISNPAEERSLMTGTLGRYYAYIKTDKATCSVPDLLLLE